jgi:hypothetical protein
MGQYFIPTFLDTHGRIVRALNPSDYGSGDKIAGHSRAVASESWCKSTGRFAASSSVYGAGELGRGAVRSCR